jgi:hypothetical protein
MDDQSIIARQKSKYRKEKLDIYIHDPSDMNLRRYLIACKIHAFNCLSNEKQKEVKLKYNKNEFED